jgi:hypothetical protein
MFTEEDAKALANATANGTAGAAAALSEIRNVSALTIRTVPAVKQRNCFDQTIADLFRVVGCLDLSVGASLDVYVKVPFIGWTRMGGCNLSFGGQGCNLGYSPYASVSVSIQGSITSGALVLQAAFLGATYNVNIITW